MSFIANVIGATGATGTKLVEQLLEDNAFSEVIIFVRRPSGFSDAKLKEHIVDFDQPEKWSSLIKGDISFSCMGTTLRDAESKSAQWKVDYDYQYNFAKSSESRGVDTFVLVSALGAKSNSWIFYNRMKGKLEEAVKELKFSQLIIFQPGMLERPESERKMETLALKILKGLNKVGILKSQKPLPTKKLAEAMILAAKNTSDKRKTLKGKEIFSYLEKSNN